jgi:hypothetical protein
MTKRIGDDHSTMSTTNEDLYGVTATIVLLPVGFDKEPVAIAVTGSRDIEENHSGVDDTSPIAAFARSFPHFETPCRHPSSVALRGHHNDSRPDSLTSAAVSIVSDFFIVFVGCRYKDSNLHAKTVEN